MKDVVEKALFQLRRETIRQLGSRAAELPESMRERLELAGALDGAVPSEDPAPQLGRRNAARLPGLVFSSFLHDPRRVARATADGIGSARRRPSAREHRHPGPRHSSRVPPRMCVQRARPELSVLGALPRRRRHQQPGHPGRARAPGCERCPHPPRAARPQSRHLRCNERGYRDGCRRLRRVRRSRRPAGA